MKNDRIAVYPPLTREEIEQEISTAKHPETVRRILNNTFDGMDAPCSVRLGAKNLDIVHTLLKANGFDVVREGEEGADDVSRILLTDSGIHFPVLNPTDAVKAVKDVTDVIGQENIVGYALPRTKESYCDYITDDPGKPRTVDINVVIDQSPEIQAMLASRNMTAQEFIHNQLEILNEKESEGIAVNPQSMVISETSLFRGGTLGNEPYVVVAREENRGVCFSSPYLEWAHMFAAGGANKHGVAYENNLNGRPYGFMYQYKTTPDQKFYGDAGIQNGKDDKELLKEATHLKGHRGNLPVETITLPYKNPVEAIYVTLHERPPLRITDENGDFISKDWEDFTKMHAPYKIVKDKEEWKRYENERTSLRENNVAQYRSLVRPDTLDLSDIKGDTLEGLDFSDYKNVILPPNITKLRNVKFSKETDCCDLTGFKNVTEMSNVDFGNAKEIKLPENIKEVDNLKFSKDAVLDLTAYNLSEVKNIDFNECKNVELPTSRPVFKNVKFPKDAVIDLNAIANSRMSELSNLDFSECKEVKLPSKVRTLNNITFPKDAQPDLTAYSHLKEMRYMDLSGYKDMTLPKQLNILHHVTMPAGTLNMEEGEHIYFEECDFSKTQNVVGKRGHIEFHAGICADLTTFDFSKCGHINLINSDISQAQMLKFPQNCQTVGSLLPKVIDVNASKNIPQVYNTQAYPVEIVLEDSFWKRLKGKITGKYPQGAEVMSSGDYKKKLEKEENAFQNAGRLEEKSQKPLQARIAEMGKQQNAAQPVVQKENPAAVKVEPVAAGKLQDKLMQIHQKEPPKKAPQAVTQAIQKAKNKER